MVKIEKLLAKLNNSSINAMELRTLLEKKGWISVRQKGSHEQWRSNVSVT